MHPLIPLRNKTNLVIYIGLWWVLGALLTILLRLSTGLTATEASLVGGPLCALYALVCLTPWYMCRSLPLATTSPMRLLVNHIGAATLATALWIAAARGLEILLGAPSALNPAIPYLIVVGLLLYLLSVALHYMLLAMEASRLAAIQARDAELRALKSQINPHFLFNCLNSISALTATDPAQARAMCIKLGDFLRNTLGLGERETVSWKEELALARTYLDVERVRFGNRLQVEVDADEACQECRVPPLVLQPLVENAIKHGIATLVDGGTIRLEARLDEQRKLLLVTVENPYDPDAPPARRSGLGLRNVRSRLETRFPSGAFFRAAPIAEDETSPRYRVEMRMPCEFASAPAVAAEREGVA